MTNPDTPKWYTVNGIEVPYGEVILRKGEPVYKGGTTSVRQPRDEYFPQPLDGGERGFGVDEDIFFP